MSIRHFGMFTPLPRLTIYGDDAVALLEVEPPDSFFAEPLPSLRPWDGPDRVTGPGKELFKVDRAAILHFGSEGVHPRD